MLFISMLRGYFTWTTERLIWRHSPRPAEPQVYAYSQPLEAFPYT